MGTHPIFKSDFDCLTECDSQLSVDWLSLPLLDPESKEVPSPTRQSKVWYSSYAFVPRWFRRFNESWWKWIPAVGVMFATTEWMHKRNHALKRKDPAEFANDE